jgi:hypothetical protein
MTHRVRIVSASISPGQEVQVKQSATCCTGAWPAASFYKPAVLCIFCVFLFSPSSY